MKKLYFLISLTFTLPALAAQPLKPATINAGIQTALNECNAALTGGAEYAVACPTFEKFTFDSSKDLKASIETEKYLSLTKSTSLETVETITSRMQGSLSYMKESGQYSNKIIREYEASINKISAIILSMSDSKFSETYIDPDTYWAPSVNADAAVIINKRKKTVYIIMMGDTDG